MNKGNTGLHVSIREEVSMINTYILQIFNFGIPMVTSTSHTSIKPEDGHSALVS